MLEDRKSTVLLKHHKNKSVGHAKGKSKSVKVHSSDQKVVDKNISITQVSKTLFIPYLEFLFHNISETLCYYMVMLKI